MVYNTCIVIYQSQYTYRNKYYYECIILGNIVMSLDSGVYESIINVQSLLILIWDH